MSLMVQQREHTGKGFNRKLRQQGLAPGVIYGKEEPLNVSMHAETMLRFIQSMKGSKRIVDLEVKSSEGSTEKKVLVHDYQMAAVGNKLVHVDFFEVSPESLITLEVPVTLVNEEENPAVESGGVIQVIRRTIPVQCKVKDIPESIEIDLVDIAYGDSIHVLDIQYPDGVEPIVYGRDFTIVTVAGRIAEEVDEEAAEEMEDEEGAVADADDEPSEEEESAE